MLRTLVPCEREVRSDARWFLGRVQPYRTLEDHIVGVVVTFVDVTEIKAAQAAVLEREEQFRRAVEDAPIPVIMHAEDGQVLQISHTWSELTGYSKVEIPTFDAWLTRAYGPGAEKVRAQMHEVFSGSEQRDWTLTTPAPGTLRDGRR